MTAFRKYKCNVKYNDTTTTGSISSEDQHKWLIPRHSAHLKKRFENSFQIKMTNKFSPLINNSTPTVHTIRNSIDNNIQGDLSLI